MRRSALVAGVMAVLFGWLGHGRVAGVAGGVGTAVLLLSFLLADDGIVAFEQLVERSALLVGRLVGFVVLVPLFFVVLTPLGLWRRARGVDALALRRDPAATTYWTPRAGRPVRADRPF